MFSRDNLDWAGWVTSSIFKTLTFLSTTCHDGFYRSTSNIFTDSRLTVLSSTDSLFASERAVRYLGVPNLWIEKRQ